MSQIHTLTGLRGIAALIVFISHAANLHFLPHYMNHGFGKVGVMLFFVLSGFLMAHMYLHRELTFVNLKAYARARIGRVFPLYLFLLVGSFLISNYINHDFYYNFENKRDFVTSIFFIHAPYVFWTIPVEVQFYAVFVVFWWLYQRGHGLIGFMSLLFLVTAPVVGLMALFSKAGHVLPAYAFEFFIGIGMSFVYHSLKTKVFIKRIVDFMGLPLFILLFINLPYLRKEFDLIIGYNATWLDPVTWLIVSSLFICAMFNSKTLSFLSWRPFRFLGEVSYGFYLIHYPCLIHLTSPDVSGIENTMLAFSATLILSYLSFQYLEKPAGNKIRTFMWSGNKHLS